jgi:probable F420-dependent oxidoreductase
VDIGLRISPQGGTTAWTPTYVREVAIAAEALGFHSLWAPERVVSFDEQQSRYPYSPAARPQAARRAGLIEPFAVLTFAAAVTSQIRLGIGVCLVPLRNPVYTAKEVASLDCLSGGRFDFGIGVGWLKEEFRALGVPWARRGQRTREYIDVMQRLWCDETSAFRGEFFDLRACHLDPRPVQSPHPPIHVGGESDAALKRVVDFGQGWYGFDMEPQDVRNRLADLTALLSQRGRSRRDIYVSICPQHRPARRELMHAYSEAGVDQVIIILDGAGETPQVVERMTELASEVIGVA